jgi:plastocyanin
MKTSLLTCFFLSLFITGYCETHTVENSGFTFSPATLTIQEGDTVVFNLDNVHNVVEVSMATWNANGNTPLAGGFQLGFGGGMILPAQLEVGTHFYVCQPHAGMGMKGTIIVQETTSIGDGPTVSALSLFPNPSNGDVNLMISGQEIAGDYHVDVYNMQGEKVYGILRSGQDEENSLDLTLLANGVYIVRVFDGTAIHSRKLILQ